jgi:hypothetical protein
MILVDWSRPLTGPAARTTEAQRLASEEWWRATPERAVNHLRNQINSMIEDLQSMGIFQ